MGIDDRPEIPVLEGQTTIEEAIRQTIREKMTVKIQKDTITEQHTMTRVIHIVDAELVECPPPPYARSNETTKLFAPDQVSIAWDVDAAPPSWLVVSGLQTKKDGTVGARRLRAHYSTDALPEWLETLLDAADPGEPVRAYQHAPRR